MLRKGKNICYFRVQQTCVLYGNSQLEAMQSCFSGIACRRTKSFMMGHTHKEPIVSTKEAEVNLGGVILDNRRNRVGILALWECGLSQYSLPSLQ